MFFQSSIKINRTGIAFLLFVITLIVVIYRRSGNATNDGDNPNEGLISLKELLSAAIDAAKRGGNEVRRIREQATLNMKSKGETKEGVNDPVTDGDLKSHLVMYYSLKKAFPELEVISEEHDTADTTEVQKMQPAYIRDHEVEYMMLYDKILYTEDVQVWIDPLDATKEYADDLRQYVTTMVGVAVKGVPTLGVVHRPFTNVTHWGVVGYGVSQDLYEVQKKNGQKKKKKAPKNPRIIVSMSHQGTVRDVATQAFGPQTEIIPAAGAGYKILEVIKGNADAYVHTTAIKKWDLCAGHAILSAVGGTMTTLDANNNIIDYSDKNDFKNDGGLLATLSNHNYYLEKLRSLKKT